MTLEPQPTSTATSMHSFEKTPAAAPRVAPTSASNEQQTPLADLTKTDTVESRYDPKSPAFWLVIMSVYLAFFLVALDRLIIATAIPAITNTFDSIEHIGWYGSGYMLTCAIFNPFFGKIYQLYDTKWTYLTSIVLFELGSVVCGAAPSSAAFIVGRAIAGIGAAGLSGGAVMVIVPLVPLHKRPVYTSFLGMAFAVSSVLGPLVGGTFTDSSTLTWRWCFYINLPIGALAFAAILFFLKLPVQPKQKLTVFAQLKRLDPFGLLFFIPSVVCLVLALQWGGSTYPWSAPKIIGLLVAFGVTFIAFLFVEFKYPETAMAPRRVILNRSVGGALFFIFFMGGGMMVAVYYVSIWFQAAKAESAMQAGIHTIAMVLALVLTGVGNAIITQKIGYYVPAMILAPVVSAIGAGLLTTLKPTSGKGAWIGFQILYGIGLGLGGQTANLVVQAVLPREDVSLGASLNFFMQQLGGSVFLAVGQSIFSQDLIKGLRGIAGLDANVIIHTGTTELRKVVPANEIVTVVNAYSHALTRTFFLSAALGAMMIVGALMQKWVSIKKDARKTPNKDVDADKTIEKSNEA